MGMLEEHKKEWVLVYQQSVKEYGEKYTGEQLSDLEVKMPGALYLPVNPEL
jgi:hypothetical protein